MSGLKIMYKKKSKEPVELSKFYTLRHLHPSNAVINKNENSDWNVQLGDLIYLEHENLPNLNIEVLNNLEKGTEIQPDDLRLITIQLYNLLKEITLLDLREESDYILNLNKWQELDEKSKIKYISRMPLSFSSRLEKYGELSTIDYVTKYLNNNNYLIIN